MAYGNGNGSGVGAVETANRLVRQIDESVWFRTTSRAAMLLCSLLGVILTIFVLPAIRDGIDTVYDHSKRLATLEERGVSNHDLLVKATDDIAAIYKRIMDSGSTRFSKDDARDLTRTFDGKIDALRDNEKRMEDRVNGIQNDLLRAR